jgi:hypothetical protein
MNDTTNTLLDFIFEAAISKLSYTIKTSYDPMSLRKAAVDAKWIDCKCVPGSRGQKTAIGVIENKPSFEQIPMSDSTEMPTQPTSAASLDGTSGLLIGLVAIVGMLLALQEISSLL